MSLAQYGDGARASARFNFQFHDAHETHGPLGDWALKRRERRAPVAMQEKLKQIVADVRQYCKVAVSS